MLKVTTVMYCRDATRQGKAAEHFTLRSMMHSKTKHGTAKHHLCSAQPKKPPLWSWFCCRPPKERTHRQAKATVEEMVLH